MSWHEAHRDDMSIDGDEIDIFAAINEKDKVIVSVKIADIMDLLLENGKRITK